MRDCTNCIREYHCDWTPAAGRGYCENWRYEKRPEVMLLQKYVHRPSGNWKKTICPGCKEECWERIGTRGEKLCIECILKEKKE